MTRYWCEDSGQYIEVEVLWDGAGPSPNEIWSRQAWHQKELPQVGDKEWGQHVGQKEMRGKVTPDIAFGSGKVEAHTGTRCEKCGEWVVGIQASKCARCRQRKHGRPIKWEQCRGCGASRYATKLTDKLRLCERCKGKSRGSAPWYPACVLCKRPFTVSQQSAGIKKCLKGTGCRIPAKEAAA